MIDGRLPNGRTLDQSMAIVADLYGTMPNQDLADKMGIKVATLVSYAYEADVAKKHVRMSYEQKAKALGLRMYRKKKILEIAWEVGASEWAIKRLFKRCGLPSRVKVPDHERIMAAVYESRHYRDFREKHASCYRLAKEHRVTWIVRLYFSK